eukprot:TRINITY_DN14404_c0_g1_i1.p1 TRINITY_DN14404_c0_g1~~TRINITY_DN14404_c0_g1_i1.p1  ORF type:complete len:179 (+),score=29.68 TRINITY_DN14404_c0_g1_i1:72-539(+)
MSPAAPKEAVPLHKWTASVYNTPEACLAKPEVDVLSSMRFDPFFWSRAYTQCIGRGMSHKECVSALPDDMRITTPGVLATPAGNEDLAGAIACMGENGDIEKCRTHLETLAKTAGYTDPVKVGNFEKAQGFCSNAGYKLLGVPVLAIALKFIKIR